MIKVFIFICILALVVPAVVYAQSPEEAGLVSQQLRDFNQYRLGPHIQKPTLFSSDFLNTVNTDSKAYEDTPAEKGGVGTINAVTAWTDIPREMAKTSEESNILLGATFGFGKGIVYGLARGASGVYDIATFGLPPYNEPLVKPVYKVNRPQHDGLKLTVLEW